MNTKILSKICLLFFLFIFINYFYVGLTTHPSEGDSLNYHIPIAKAYLDGAIFTPEKIQGVPFLKYSPGASEGILAIFYLLHIPPNLYNVVGVVLLFSACIYLGKKYGLNPETSIIFASSVSMINGIVRWLDTQIIDIYLAAFFVITLALLKKPEKTIKYFLFLGMATGMLVGSKYSGILFGGVLFLVFGRKVLSVLSFQKFLAFIIPLMFIGGFWYIRNYIVTGNPMYPQGFLFFEDYGFDILEYQVWRVITGSISGFLGTVNALISEYMVWILSIPIVILFLLKSRGGKVFDLMLPLVITGIFSLFIYSMLPSDNIDHIMVSVIRYSYPAFIPFILSVFLIAKKYKKEEVLGIIAIANMFFIGFPIFYYPKLLFFYIPLALFAYFKK
ncbi:MAG: hypothetical protein Q7T54_01830 [Candidatus Levybacteria bacterium]|nr:hypothetical protein [Candidatus Levybacteria bacterium]